MKNSANTNLLILDEVFDSSLDAGGTEEFLKLLDILSERCNIFVISHKADQLADKFSKSMTFEKRGNFSKDCLMSISEKEYDELHTKSGTTVVKWKASTLTNFKQGSSKS